jgi:mono/diheme cytochrome c family protein
MALRMNLSRRLVPVGLAVFLSAAALPHAASQTAPAAKTAAAVTPAPAPVAPKEVIDRYCVSCHSERLHVAELVLENRDLTKLGDDADVWEKVVQKLQSGAMPPAGNRRPEPAVMKSLIATLQTELDKAALAKLDPGRAPLHRLNRTEYANVIRDIFGVEVDAKALLPADDSGYGFDNIADVLTISPGLLERYMVAASKISRTIVGDATMKPNSAIHNIPYLSLDQRARMSEELPFGSRGGIAIKHYFPLDGTYKVKFFLQNNDLAAGDAVRGLGVPNQIDVRLDRKRVQLFSVGGRAKPSMDPYANSIPNGYDDEKGLEATFQTTAGEHVIGISFNRDAWSMEGIAVGQLPVTNQGFSQGRDTTPAYGRVDAGLEQVIITGPYEGKVPVASPVRKRLFVCTPATAAEEEPCARRIVGRVARLAFRRPVAEPELKTLMEFYQKGRGEGSFDTGIQLAVMRLLVDVNFLFRPERDPQGAKPGQPFKISDLELASRLSFFLWSSGPDDQLITIASQGKLRSPGVLEQQVKRMLADPRADAMVTNFFSQWLTTKNVLNQRPDPKVFPEFDENLRQAFLKETDLFLQSQVREDRPVPELLTANYTFVNERLAKHYDIPNVRGEQFRRVALKNDARAGLLGHGSVLTVTSYNDRTSVVMRGKWIMDTIMGTPPPPPPNPLPPPLSDTKIAGSLRQRMEAHRKNPVCSACHNILDPLGFGLENFDGVGQFRTVDGGATIDPSGSLADGSKFNNPATYRTALMGRRDAFLTNLTKHLMTYALGRGVETRDMPAVRAALKSAAPSDYRWSSLILGIVKSTPFQMRRAES